MSSRTLLHSPTVGVNCKLTLKKHAYRRDATIPTGGKYEADPYTHARFERPER